MSADNPSIALKAFRSYRRLGSRLAVYVTVLPLTVALAVTLDVGLGVPMATVALVGTLFTLLLMLAVPLVYAARRRNPAKDVPAPDPLYAFSVEDLRRIRAGVIANYRYHLLRSEQPTSEYERLLLKKLIWAYEAEENLKHDPVDTPFEDDKGYQAIVAPLAEYLDYLGAVVNEFDGEPQRFRHLVGILESLNSTAAERWRLEPQLNAAYHRALRDVAQALDSYIMKNLASRNLQRLQLFRQEYEHTHKVEFGYGRILDPDTLFDPKR